MSFNRFFTVLLTFFLFSGALYAQKHGHLNLGNAVALMPETKAADADLAAYQTQLIEKGEEMAKKFQENYNKYLEDARTGNFTPVQLKEREEALQGERDSILEYDQEIQRLVQKKREELLGPIFLKVQEAIREVAKENGYALVFDSSVFNTLLFAQEQDDLMPLLKAKLGIE